LNIPEGLIIEAGEVRGTVSVSPWSTASMLTFDRELRRDCWYGVNVLISDDWRW
jgi:hypothetical protein